MGVARELPPIPTVFAGENARKIGRVRVEMIRCSLGDVLDVSAGGMRVRVKGRPPEERDVITVRVEGLVNPVEVKAAVVWVARRGWRTQELGLRFEELSPEARSELAAIARSSALNTAQGMDRKRRAG